MAVRKGLGKGLDTLIPAAPKSGTPIKKKESSKTDPNQKSVQEEVSVKKPETMVKISLVEPNREQPRKVFEEDALLELADSIKQFGILQPILVQKRKDYYEIIAGERRWRAAKMAGLKEVPVIFKELTEEEITEIALIENLQRENLNAIEEAQAYRKLMEAYDLKQDEIADKVSKSRTAITNSLRLLKLDERVQQMVIDKMLTTGHVRTLLAIEDKEKQYELATYIFDQKLSVRETEKLIKKMTEEPKEKPVKKIDMAEAAIYESLEESMKGVLGTKVSIHKKSKHKGQIEIEYYSEQELERIIDLIRSIQV